MHRPVRAAAGRMDCVDPFATPHEPCWQKATALHRSAKPAKNMAVSIRSAGGLRPNLRWTASRRSKLEYPELGMEAVWRIEVENFPAFIVTDDKGNDFFANI